MDQQHHRKPPDVLPLAPAAGNLDLCAGHGSRAAPPRGPLSARELQVLALVSCGYSNKRIARDIFISENTVKFHLKNAFGKLRVNRRAQAVMAARCLGEAGPASAPRETGSLR